MIEVTLTDFVLKFPLKAEEHENQGEELWTTFEEMNSCYETTCQMKCHHKLHCFTYFFSDSGCFFVLGNRRKLESSTGWAWSSALSSERKLSGEFRGCRQADPAAMGKCPRVEKSDGSYGLLQFRNIRPDWRGSLANLGFVLTLNVGGQHFASDTGSVQLRRGFPVPNEVIGILLAEADGHYQLIDTSFWIDGGEVVVNVSKFDPANFSTLNLSVLPLLPDPVPRLSTFLNNF